MSLACFKDESTHYQAFHMQKEGAGRAGLSPGDRESVSREVLLGPKRLLLRLPGYLEPSLSDPLQPWGNHSYSMGMGWPPSTKLIAVQRGATPALNRHSQIQTLDTHSWGPGTGTYLTAEGLVASFTS